MKKLVFILSVLLSSLALNAQYGCFSPSLGIYDASTNAALSATLPCTYSNVISIEPTQFYSGNNATSPCMMLEIGTTNLNSQTNNSLTMYQGTTAIISLCSSTPVPCWTVIPNSSSYSLTLAFLNPTASHSYSLCNILTAGTFTYKVKSCYSSAVIQSGSWLNTSPNFCQGINIPANTPIGTASYSISPAVPSTASLSNPTGYLLLDTYQMTAGVYSVTYMFDSQASCSVAVTRTIMITNPFNAGWTNLTPKCTYNGCINLNPQITGTGSGTFTGVGVSSNSFCPGVAGVGSHAVTYTVGLTPQCGATITNTIIVAPQPTANAGPTQSLTCLTNPTVLAGSGGGTYSWSMTTLGNNFSTSSSPTVGIPGFYTLTVSNGTCTSATSTMEVGSNTTPPTLPSISVSNVLNCINPTATITATGSNITYTWTGPGIISGANSAAPTVSVGGTYNYTVTSTINGCPAVGSQAVTQNTSVSMALSTTGAALNCTNNATSISGNQPTYSYTWVAPATGTIVSGQSSATLNILGTGVYTLNATNPANGCNITTTVIPTTNTAAITPTISNNPVVTCANATVTLNGLPGSGVTYTWSGPAVVGSPNNANANVSAGGIYTLAVTNTTNGCVGTRTISIATSTLPPSTPTISPTNVMLACPAQTALITGTATGAASYSWIPPAGGSILSGGATGTAQVTSSTPGIFTVVATGTNGCPSTETVLVSPNTNAPTFSLSNPNPSITCASATPSITVNITSTVAITSYSWGPAGGISGPTNTTSATFTAAGSYTVIITAANGCISTGVVNVGTATISPSIVAGTGTASPLSCTNSLTVIDPSITPSSPNYTYTWSGPSIVGSPNNSSVTVNGPGTYTLAITDTLTGCTSAAITVTVTGNNAVPSINASSSSSLGIGCSPSTSTIQLTATSTSTNSVTFLWSTAVAGSVITVSSAGIYTVVVTDPTTGCSNAATVAVSSASTAPGFSLTSAGNLPCGTGATLQLNATSSSTNAVTYAWAGTSIISGSNSASAIVNGPGVYTVVATDVLTGCTGTSTLAVLPSTVLAGFSTNTTTGQPPLTIAFTNTSLGASTYSWVSFSGGSSNPSFTNGSVSTSTNPEISFNQSGTYTVILTSFNGICSDTAMVIIKVGEELTIPEIFTPNGDGKNDPFYIPGLDAFPKNSLKIYNRWGNIVYEAAPYNNDWNGIPNKGGIGSGKLPVGAYFYILDLGDEKEEIRKGFVQLEY